MPERAQSGATRGATRWVERVLKIPPAPSAPAGAHDSLRTFRGARGFYRYRQLRWAAKQLAAGWGLLLGFAFVIAMPRWPYAAWLEVLEVASLVTFVVAAWISFLMIRLDYELRWYIVTDRSLRIREGLGRVTEKTMSFANIQNIAVRQGPIQRLLGIADVEVRTAGGGGAKPDHKGMSEDLHLAYFRGVDNAEEIRDAILLRVRQLRDAGLGDPDLAERDPPPSASARPGSCDSPETLAAARGLLEEVRALRRALSLRRRA
jgi:membrane protein YdbS with pleckstrin-like domain